MDIPIPTDLDISPEDMEAGLVTLPVEFMINLEENTLTPISLDGVEIGLDEEVPTDPDAEAPIPEDESTEAYVASEMAAMGGGQPPMY